MTQELDLEQMARDYRAFTQQVLAANPDLAERLRTLPRSVEYDPSTDMLFLTLEERPNVVMHSVRNRYFLRLDPDSLRIVGLEVLDATAALSESPSLKRLSGALAALGGELRELVMAAAEGEA